MRTHPTVKERRFRVDLLPHPSQRQQYLTVNVPANHWKMQFIPTLQPFEQQQRPYKLFVIVNGLTLARSVPTPMDPVDKHAQQYDGQLHPGVNVIQVNCIAALPQGEKLPNGSTAELEKITILANLLRH